jgi:hypothetical protein
MPGGSTRLTGGSAGVLFYNNTILSETTAASASNVHWQNNLVLGQQSSPAIFTVNTLTTYSTSDYNGFRPNPGAPFSFAWNTPGGGKTTDFTSLTTPAGPGRSPLDVHQFTSLGDYAQASGQDRHSVLVDYDIFVKVPPLNAQDRTSVQKVYRLEELDFRLKPESAAIDKGGPLAQITEGYAGAAPDLGALEFDRPLPHYGPR